MNLHTSVNISDSKTQPLTCPGESLIHTHAQTSAHGRTHAVSRMNLWRDLKLHLHRDTKMSAFVLNKQKLKNKMGDLQIFKKKNQKMNNFLNIQKCT